MERRRSAVKLDECANANETKKSGKKKPRKPRSRISNHFEVCPFGTVHNNTAHTQTNKTYIHRKNKRTELGMASGIAIGSATSTLSSGLPLTFNRLPRRRDRGSQRVVGKAGDCLVPAWSCGRAGGTAGGGAPSPNPCDCRDRGQSWSLHPRAMRERRAHCRRSRPRSRVYTPRGMKVGRGAGKGRSFAVSAVSAGTEGGP